MPISLREVADHMEGALEGCSAFLNCTTGEIVVATADDLYDAEVPAEDTAPAARKELLAKLAEVIDSEEWMEIPRNETHDDYRVMERFCEEEVEDEVQETLFEAIDGKGAFRRFRAAVDELNLRDKWERFRLNVMRELAAAWLEDQAVEFVE